MYAVVNHLQFSKPVDEFREILHNEGIPLLAAHDGFIQAHCVKKDEFNAIIIILWKDAEAAQSGAKSFGPTWFTAHLKPWLIGPEGRSTGEVIASSL